MHPFSILTLAIFVAGYITARWDLVTRLYDLAIFAWDHGVVVRRRASIHKPTTADRRLYRLALQKGLLYSRFSSSCSSYPWKDSPRGKQIW